MKKLISSIIAIMMVLTMMPYTAFAADAVSGAADTGGIADTETKVSKDLIIGQAEEITIYYYENKKVTVESENTSIAYGMVTNSSMIISSGTVLYGTTIKITPAQIGTVDLIISANGEVDKIYTINVKPVVVSEDVHMGESSVFEVVSFYNEVMNFIETEGVSMNVLSRTQRVSTMTVNGVAVTEVQYLYEIKVDYEQPGQYDYSFSGEQSGEMYKVTATVTDHDWETEPAVDREPTCTEEGLQSVHCTMCDAVMDESAIPVLEHTYEWVVDQMATEQAPGSMHEECTVCGEVRNEGTVIEQLTHTHELEKTEAVAATCTAGGNPEYYTCTACGNYYRDENAMEQLAQQETVTPPAGHTVAIRSAVAATCTEEGTTEEAYCTVCEEILVPHKIVLPKGHSYSTLWKNDENSHWYECECGLRQDETAHDFEWVIDKEPTEQEAGIKHEECTVCHAKRNRNTNIDKLMHVSDLVKIEAVAATCTTAGHIEYYYCRSCGNFYSDESTDHLISVADTVIKAKGHNYSEWMTISKSTCVRKGYEFTSCKDCGIAEIRELSLKDHKVRHITKEPTCTNSGAEITQCETCDMQISEEIPATGHNEVPIEIAPSCTAEGWTNGIRCSICDATLKKPESVAPTGHTYSEWIVEKAPTCKDPGAEYSVCSTCKYVETALIARLAHTGEVIPETPATCAAAGLTAGIYCTTCNTVLKEQETIEKTPHSWSSDYTIDKRATISSGGSMSHHCTVCNASDKTSAVKIYMIKKTTVSSPVYNGSVRVPAVKVVDNAGSQLQAGTDYTVTYKNAAGTKTVKPKLVGTYKAVVTFKGMYSGSVTKTFKINPKATAVTGLTKGKNQFTAKWNKRTEQVTGYQMRYSLKSNMSSAKYVTVKNNKTVSRTVKNLKAKKKYWVQVRTYKTVNGTKYYSAWSTKKSVTTK